MQGGRERSVREVNIATRRAAHARCDWLEREAGRDVTAKRAADWPPRLCLPGGLTSLSLGRGGLVCTLARRISLDFEPYFTYVDGRN